MAEPLEAETFASSVASLWQKVHLVDEEPERLFGEGLIAYLVRRRSRDGLAMLLALATVGSPRMTAAARAAASSVVARGVEAPAWADEIGQVQPGGAWVGTDEYGDQDAVALAFEYEGRGTHTLVSLVDHNLGGVVKEAFVAGDPEEVLETWREVMHLPIRELPPEDAAERLRSGFETYDAYLDPPSSDDVRLLRGLFLARLERLPRSIQPIAPVETNEEERASLVGAFIASPEATALLGDLTRPPAGDRGVVEVIAHHLVDFKCDYADGDPLRWSPTAVEICLLDWFPRKVALEETELQAVPAIVRAWVHFAGRRRGLSDEAMEATETNLDEFVPEFLEASSDPARFGPAKAIALAMQADDVDLTDQAAVGRWIEAYNSRPQAEREAVLPRAARPAPAPTPATTGEPDQPGAAARRDWAVPARTGRLGSIDLAWLDRDDPDERAILIRAEHPELREALEPDVDLDTADGPLNPRLHLALHEAVANQLWQNDPPEVWATAQRLTALGYDRHEVLHMLASAISGELWHATREPEFKRDRFLSVLAALPDR